MTGYAVRSLAAVLLVSLSLIGCSPSKPPVGVVSVQDAWARATPPGASVGAAYLTITNNSDHAIKLTGAVTAVADHVEMHTMSMDGNLMQMRPIEGGLEVAAGASATFEPAGNHFMLIGL